MNWDLQSKNGGTYLLCSQIGGFTSHSAEVARELGSKCVPQLCLGSYLETRWSAIGQLFSLSLVTVPDFPDVFGKVISAQFPPQLPNPSISNVFIVNSVECAYKAEENCLYLFQTTHF